MKSNPETPLMTPMLCVHRCSSVTDSPLDTCFFDTDTTAAILVREYPHNIVQISCRYQTGQDIAKLSHPLRHDAELRAVSVDSHCEVQSIVSSPPAGMLLFQ